MVKPKKPKKYNFSRTREYKEETPTQCAAHLWD